MCKADYDMIVVGGGPGGYTAALYGARAGLSVLVLEMLSPGGQMATTENVDNYPGFPEGADGFELGEKMQQGAHRFGAVTRFEEVKAIWNPTPNGWRRPKALIQPARWCFPPGRPPAGWLCRGKRRLQAAVWPTVPRVTVCITGAKR